MSEFLLPRTDGGVAIQLAIVILTTIVLAAAARRERALVLLVVGVGLVLIGLMGVRALH